MEEEKKDLEAYLLTALSDSLIKKSKSMLVTLDDIKSLRFESWWVESGQKNMISVIFRVDG